MVVCLVFEPRLPELMMPWAGQFIFMEPSQIHDLQLVNWLAKADPRRSRLCYKIKDALLNEFGTHAGYCCQSFTRDDWDEFGGVYSYHKHILEQINIGEAVFHRPTAEFHYENIHEVIKQSDRFSELHALCTDFMVGLKQAPEDFGKDFGARALRRLVHALYQLLRDKIVKPPRTLYPFIKARTWLRGFDGYDLRVPESVIVCAGCGRKLTLSLDRLDDPKNTEVGLFGPHPERGLRIRCDTSVYRLGKCPEIRKERDHHGWQDPNWPWIHEREVSANWARLLIPEYLEWKARQEVEVNAEAV